MSVFAQFHSADILLLYPSFTTSLRIENIHYTYENALGAWYRHAQHTHADQALGLYDASLL